MKKFILVLLCINIHYSVSAQITLSIQINQAGTLKEKITTEQKSTITSLTIMGNLNSLDINFMRDSLLNLTYVDLSNVNIIASNLTEYIKIQYSPADEMPQFSFYRETWQKKANIKTIILPKSLKSIGLYAFYGCSELSNITFPNTLSSIGDFAFFSCSSLANLNLPNSIVSIGNSTFSNCNIKGNVVLPSNLRTIGEGAFIGCFSGHLKIPNSVLSIGSNAFYSCGFDSVTVGISVTSIGIMAFGDMKNLNYISLLCPLKEISDGFLANSTVLKKIIIPNSVTMIGDEAFANCTSLISVNIPDKITNIGYGAFANCVSLNDVKIPSSVNQIGSWAFLSCENLNSITIPKSVESLGDYVFENCKGLNSIYNESIVPVNLDTVYGVFKGVDKNNCVLYVPIGSKNSYKAAYQWKDFFNITEFGASTVNNPKQNVINILYNSANRTLQIFGINTPIKVSVYSITGKLYINSMLAIGESLELQSIPYGVYIVNVAIKGQLINKEIIIK